MTDSTFETIRTRLHNDLSFVYGAEQAAELLPQLLTLINRYRQPAVPARPTLREQLTHADAMLITYGDQISEDGVAPLHSLSDVLQQRIAGLISCVHILPFYPYTSDDGFSVVDYRMIDPQLGDWSHVQRLSQHFRLMFDAVVNHISASSAWFQGFLRDQPPYTDYFVVVDPTTDLSQVTRPRALPLLTAFETPSGTKHVWTTFSADQIDLNVANPAVLLELVDILLEYAQRGAQFIRLDAIGYLWKTIGTRCIHLEHTHRIVQLWRSVLDAVSPNTMLITETNVPHRDNISYFGDGSNEAQLVYQFPLAPLVLHAFTASDAAPLTGWAAALEPPGENVTFFNFLASHDGIGVMPATGILQPRQILALAERVQHHGGHVSYKNNADGSQSPYELNITFFDALNDPNSAEAAEAKIDRFICSQALMLALAGLPGIYIHSLFGSHNFHAGVAATGRYRSINRQKWQRGELEAQLDDPHSHAAQVFRRYARLLKARAAHPAFHPLAAQQIIDAGAALFVVQRGSGANAVLCLHNVTSEPQRVALPSAFAVGATILHNLIDGAEVGVTTAREVQITPLGCLWLRP
jgi:sucrose phosphorylase